jgi:hypothetical protein
MILYRGEFDNYNKIITNSRLPIDLSPFEWNFDLDKSGQKFHHCLKEHHKISNIPKFRCEMLKNADNIALRSLPFFSHFVLQMEIDNQFDH